MTAKRNFETRFRSAIRNINLCKLFPNGVASLLILIFYSASAQNLSIQMYINGDPYNTANDLNLCSENEICLKITNNTGDSKTITARVGLNPSFINVIDIEPFSFIGGTYHEYQVVDTYSAYEEKEFCLEFCIINGYGSLQNRFSASMSPGGSSNQVSTLYTMPGLDLSGTKMITGPTTVTQAISNITLLDCPDCESNSQNIFLNGTLEIDQDYTFFGSSGDRTKIQMGPNAKILVKKDKTLTLIYSNIFGCSNDGCGYLWESIEVEPGGKLSLDYCNVSDAAYAIRILSDESSDQSSVIIHPILSGTRLALWPNPASDQMAIRLDPIPPRGQVRYAVYSISGKLVASGIVSDPDNQLISLHGLAAGIYILDIQLPDAAPIIERFVKR